MTPDEHRHMCRRDIGDYGTDEAHLKNTVCGGWWRALSSQCDARRCDTPAVVISPVADGAQPELQSHDPRLYVRRERVGRERRRKQARASESARRSRASEWVTYTLGMRFCTPL